MLVAISVALMLTGLLGFLSFPQNRQTIQALETSVKPSPQVITQRRFPLLGRGRNRWLGALG